MEIKSLAFENMVGDGEKPNKILGGPNCCEKTWETILKEKYMGKNMIVNMNRRRIKPLGILTARNSINLKSSDPKLLHSHVPK